MRKTMAKKLSTNSKNSLAADAPAHPNVAVSSVGKPAQKRQPAWLTQPARLPAAAPAADTGPSKAPVLAKAPVPTASQSVTVTFALHEPHARQVFLCGAFNGWASEATPMTRHDGGVWKTTFALAPGRHEYKFVVDGQWMPDPAATENAWNQHGTLNSVIEVQA